MLLQLLSICSTVTQVRLSNMTAPDNAHMALHRCPTFNACRAFLHTFLCKAYFTSSIQALRASSQFTVPLMRWENTLSPIITVQLHLYAKPNMQYPLNCWMSLGLTLHVRIHLTFSAGCLKHYLGLRLDLLFVLPLNSPRRKRLK